MFSHICVEEIRRIGEEEEEEENNRERSCYLK